ncbi:hypothetical protein [Dyadobacter sp. CY347]|uniref:hypothetical protein n=1 Tax=Dyadobacter sp. CY347 TaxID=2909336 RepID=UPI001F405F94|nr:hypothetical protein [Dyadobacter sp. CY347]MCF2489069.1 hypothetical protein [Dyadobacter sp. CY347]
MDYLKTFSVVVGILVIYAVPCFLAHFLDFGWKFATGDWLHQDLKLIKKLRSGFFHKALIFFVLAIILYGGVREILQIIPETWGYLNKTGQLQPYRRPIASIVSIILSAIIMGGFGASESNFADKNSPPWRGPQ